MAKRYKRILEKKTLSKPGSTQQTNLKNIQLLLLPLEYGTTTQNSTEKNNIHFKDQINAGIWTLGDITDPGLNMLPLADIENKAGHAPQRIFEYNTMHRAIAAAKNTYPLREHTQSQNPNGQATTSTLNNRPTNTYKPKDYR